jgi:hypothetical protein
LALPLAHERAQLAGKRRGWERGLVSATTIADAALPSAAGNVHVKQRVVRTRQGQQQNQNEIHKEHQSTMEIQTTDGRKEKFLLNLGIIVA